MIEFDISKYENIVISSHVNPDADSVGSCTALALALKKLNKNVVILLENYGNKYNFFNNKSFLMHNPNEMNNSACELFISLDCGDELRLGEFISVFNKAKTTINVDHHISNTNFADYNFVFNKSSTSEIIYEFIVQLNIELDKDIAKALYGGILADTGGFKFSNTTSRTHEIIAELIKFDISPTEIYQEIFNNHSYTSVKLLGRALDRIDLFFDGKVACSYITLEDLKEFNGDKTQLGNIIDNLINIKNVVIAIFIYEKDNNECKVSMRSTNNNSNIYDLCIEFSGGGHIKACGCTINGKAEEVQSILLDKLNEKF